MYADDTTIMTFQLLISREQEINKELKTLNNWFNLNKLTLDVDKTKCCLFTNVELFLPLIYQ